MDAIFCKNNFLCLGTRPQRSGLGPQFGSDIRELVAGAFALQPTDSFLCDFKHPELNCAIFLFQHNPGCGPSTV